MRALFAVALLFLAGCGFRPLYATTDGEGAGLSRMLLTGVDASDAIKNDVALAFGRRTARDETAALYDLAIKADEQADRLAVQIDASVTRFNYRIAADYTLTERATGKRYTGRVESIASFNVVDSQYSTLYAEAAAKDKAARQLVEEVERHILLAIEEDKAAKSAKAALVAPPPQK